MGRPLHDYDPLLVSITIGAITLDGYADGVFWRGARDFDRNTITTSTSGDTIRNVVHKDNATMSVMVHDGTQVNQLLADLAESNEIVNFSLIDNNGGDTVSAKAWIKRPPDDEKGMESGINEWQIAAHDYTINHGGLTQV